MMVARPGLWWCGRWAFCCETASGLVGLGPSADARDVEIAALRHQLAGAASAGCPPPVQPDRSDAVGGPGPVATSGPVASVLVTPATRLRWHRELVARRWTYLPAGGTRRILPEPRSMWCFVWRRRTRGGDLRTVGEARKLWITVFATSVRVILRQHARGPEPGRGGGPSWVEFLRAGQRGRWRRISSPRDVALTRLYMLLSVELDWRGCALLGSPRTRPRRG
jgi:hypothetical protein